MGLEMGSEEKSPSRPGQGSRPGWRSRATWAGARRQEAVRGGHSRGRGRRLAQRLGDSAGTSPGLQAPGRRLPRASEVPRAPGSGTSRDPAHPWASLLLLPCPPGSRQDSGSSEITLLTLHLRRHQTFDVSQLPNPPTALTPTGLSTFSGSGWGAKGAWLLPEDKLGPSCNQGSRVSMPPEGPPALRVPVCDVGFMPLPHGACGPKRSPWAPCEDRAVGGPLPRCHDPSPSPALELGPGSMKGRGRG